MKPFNKLMRKDDILKKNVIELLKLILDYKYENRFKINFFGILRNWLDEKIIEQIALVVFNAFAWVDVLA